MRVLDDKSDLPFNLWWEIEPDKFWCGLYLEQARDYASEHPNDFQTFAQVCEYYPDTVDVTEQHNA